MTLGTPHLPPEPPGVDMTRGALTHVHENYPGKCVECVELELVMIEVSNRNH